MAVLKERIRTHPETRWKIRGDTIYDNGPFSIKVDPSSKVDSSTTEIPIASDTTIEEKEEELTVVVEKGSEKDSDSEDSLAGYNFEDEPEHIKEAVKKMTNGIIEELRNATYPSSSDEDDSDED